MQALIPPKRFDIFSLITGGYSEGLGVWVEDLDKEYPTKLPCTYYIALPFAYRPSHCAYAFIRFHRKCRDGRGGTGATFHQIWDRCVCVCVRIY